MRKILPHYFLPLCLYADHDGLAQVLTNLLENALKYTPTGGQVMLGAAEQNGQIAMTVATSDNPLGQRAEGDLLHFA
ncbi:MAG: hypothetical protein R3A44_00350 [Caldilineaceae bacterium]